MRNHRGILGAAISGVLLFGTVGSALSAPAVATSNVNVRSGPGSNYQAVDTIRRGERVDVQGCEGGWCYIEKRGPDGWVSWRYLAEASRPSRPAVTFQFNFGNPPRFDRPGHHGDGPGRPGNNNGPGNGPGNGGHNDSQDHHNGPGGNGNHDGPDWNGGNNHAGQGNGPDGPRPCVPGRPNFPFCQQ
jgi:SH3 domain-containing protein